MSSTSDSDYSTTHPPPFTSPPLFIVLTIILLVFFFVGFFFVYFCRCFMENLIRTSSGNLRSSNTTTNNGLDPSQLQAFPTFVYSSVKDFRKEKYGLECAICLLEFEDHSFLRLLNFCYHVFHQECIDLWLESHKTCPVCRRDLENPPPNEKSQDSSINNDHHGIHDIHVPSVEDHDHESSEEDHDRDYSHYTCIDIREDDPDHDVNRDLQGHDPQDCCISTTLQQQHQQGKQNNDNKEVRFCRSHSTGHSIVLTRGGGGGGGGGVGGGVGGIVGEGEDKYTLRLPEEVIKAKILRGHNWTKSCTTFNEMGRHGAGNSDYEVVSGCFSNQAIKKV